MFVHSAPSFIYFKNVSLQNVSVYLKQLFSILYFTNGAKFSSQPFLYCITMAHTCHTLAPLYGERSRLLITSEDTEVGKVFHLIQAKVELFDIPARPLGY